MKNIVFVSIDPLIYRRRVLNQMSAAGDLGLNAAAITPRPEISSQFQIHYIQTRYKRGPLRFISYNLQILRLLKTYNKIDLIHARGLWVLPAVISFRKKHACTVIYDAHEYFPGHELFEKSLWRRLTWLKIEKRAIPLIDMLITVSQPLAEEYRRLYPDLKKAEVVRNLPALRDEIIEKDINEDDATARIIFHGYFLPGRALFFIIEALSLLDDTAFEMVFLGEGPLKEEMEARVQENDLSSKVQFKPFVESGRLLTEISSADIGLCLIEADSFNREHALPNKFFEYIHAAVPVLASNIPTLLEMTEKHQTGICVNPRDSAAIAQSLRRMIGNKKERLRWRQNCIKARNELNWQNEEKKLKALYHSLIQGTP